MRPAFRLGVLTGLAAACQPGPASDTGAWPCATTPAAGQAVAREVLCGDDIPGAGEGRIGDQWLGNAWLRVVVRSAQGSATQAGVDGSTVVDVAPWGFRDRMHEVFPLVGGGWLDVEDVRVEDDGVRVTGTVRSLPALDPVAEGARAEIVWRLDPDGPWLHAEGAEGLLLHPRGDATLEEGRLVVEGVTHAAEGAWTDLGGAVRIDGADRLLVAPSDEALAWLHPNGREVRIEAPEAEQVDILDGDEVLATVSAGSDPFTTRLPDRADGLRARASARAASAVASITSDVWLQPGDEGVLEIVPAWTGRPRALAVTWTGSAGHGRVLLPPDGGLVPTGPGPATVNMSGQTWSGDVVDGEVWLPTVEGDPSPRMRVGLSWPSDRSWTWRGTDTTAVMEASASGWDHVVLTADRDVPAGPEDADDGASWSTGTRTTAARVPLVAWSLSDNGRRAGHGAPNTTGLDVLEALALLSQGGRSTLAPVGALEGTEPWALDPAPSHVLLGDPAAEGPLSAWAPWMALVDAGLSSWPAGPALRVRVPHPDAASTLDVEAGLVRGHLAATTGPDVWLTVDGAMPGELRSEDAAGPPVATLSLDAPGTVDRVGLLVDGGLLGPYLPESLPDTVVLDEEARWVALAVWTSTGGDWAVTAPVWLRPAAP